MKQLLSVFRNLADFSRMVFPFILILYLVLFLLENLFHGFVTNIFDLNILLIPVFLSLFFAAFFQSEDNKEEKATRNDYLLIGILAFTGFAVLFLKTREMGISGLIISVGAAFLVAFMSIVILKDDNDKEEVKETQREFHLETRGIRKRFHFSPVRALVLSVFLVLIGIFALIYTKQEKKVQEKKLYTNNEVQVSKYKTYLDNRDEKIPDKEIIKKTQILLINATKDENVTSDMMDFLKEFGFTSFQKGVAEEGRYTYATLQFNEKDATAASYLAFLINSKYENIELLPMESTKSGVILILGEQK